MGFDLRAELDAVAGQGYELYGKYLNPQLPRTLHTIGFDKVYVRGEGAYLYDDAGNAYADFLSGFGGFATGEPPAEAAKLCNAGWEAMRQAGVPRVAAADSQWCIG